MAGGLFDKALATWDAMFGTDELRAVLEDEQAENALLLEQLAEARAEIASLRRRLNTAYSMVDNLQAQLEQRNGATVRQQYSDVDAWQEATGDMVQ